MHCPKKIIPNVFQDRPDDERDLVELPEYEITRQQDNHFEVTSDAWPGPLTCQVNVPEDVNSSTEYLMELVAERVQLDVLEITLGLWNPWQ